MDTSITTFGSCLASITRFLTNVSHQDFLVAFLTLPTFTLNNSLMYILWNTSDVEICMSSSTCPEFCRSACSTRSCLSPVAGCSKDTCMVEADVKLKVLAQIELCSSTCQVFLHVLSPILFYTLWMSPSVYFSCCFSHTPDAIRHLLSIVMLHRHIIRSSFYSRSFSVFHSLYLTVSLFVCTHLSLVRHGSLNSCPVSFSTFIVVWCCRRAMRCQRSTTWTTSSVAVSLNVNRATQRRSSAQPVALFHLQSSAMVVLFVQCQMRLSSSVLTLTAIICHRAPHKPYQLAASHASLCG